MSIVSALRGARQVYRAERAEAALLAAHRSAVEAHLRAGERYESAHADWARQRVLLRTIADEARAYHGIGLSLPESFAPRPGEALYAHAAAGGLFELRGSNAQELMMLDAGEVWVTSLRVIFAGTMVREWDLDAAHAPVHHGATGTVLPAVDRLRTSGISYPGPHQDGFRRRLELAHATVAGTRQALIDAAEQALGEHLAAEPTPPGPPPVAPVVQFVGEHARVT